MLSVLNTVYKVLVVYTGIALTVVFTKRDALIQQMEMDAGFGPAGTSSSNATTSSGEPVDARSLAAQAGR